MGITENTGGIKYRQIQLFTLFGGEKVGEWPNDSTWISKIL